MKRSLVAVIPVHGREELVKHTVGRLFEQSYPLHDIICVGDRESEKEAVLDAGGHFVYRDNYPLGAKWQYGIDVARSRGATDILIMGSSDWVSTKWCEVIMTYILAGYDMVGKGEYYLLDFARDGRKRILQWTGYPPPRDKEPIGIGRVISNNILEKMHWQVYDPWINSSLDFSTQKRVLKAGGSIKFVEDDTVKSLSLSFPYKWYNKHSWVQEASMFPKSVVVRDVEGFLKEWFPDALELVG